ncbi:hypothetical protein LCGC14_2427200, partial [marine sediment metagenome]
MVQRRERDTRRLKLRAADSQVRILPAPNAVRQFKIEEDEMIWTGKGKHEGKDVNDVPVDYIEWAAKESKNPTTKEQATKILAFRNSGAGMPGKASASAAGGGTAGQGTR